MDLNIIGKIVFRYRGELSTVFLIVLFLFHLLSPSELKLVTAPFWINGLGIVFITIGVAVRVHVIGHAPARTSGRNKGRQVADELITTGLYSIVRHPLYMGNILVWLGVICWTKSLLLLTMTLAFASLLYRAIIATEDAFLAKKYPEKHSDWKRNVPAILPGFKHYQKSAQPFNLQKVLYREKNGWVAIVIVIAGINATAVRPFFTDKTVLTTNLVAMGVATAYYIVLKLIYKRTSWLQRVDQ